MYLGMKESLKGERASKGLQRGGVREKFCRSFFPQLEDGHEGRSTAAWKKEMLRLAGRR
jgi:hypothetical protein